MGLGVVHACMHGSYKRWSWAGMDCTRGIQVEHCTFGWMGVLFYSIHA
jgi:hypothetical protein